MMVSFFRRTGVAILAALLALPLNLAIPAQDAFAGVFSAASLRFSRSQVSAQNVEILVVAKPATAGVETKSTLTFASGYSVTTSAAAITTTTSNLPNAYQGQALTAWPGVGSSAIAVSGQTVTFSSGDLATGTLYGFYITAGIHNPASFGSGEYQHVLATKTIADTTVDSATVTSSVRLNDQVAITGTIPATPSNTLDSFSVDVGTESTNAYVDPDTIRTYTITYGSASIAPTNFTLEAQFDLGAPQGSTQGSFEVVTYVPGSASTAYGDAPPIIDLDNRRISWEITNFPANTANKTVTFQLKTSGPTLSAIELYYKIKARLIANSITVQSEPLGQIYRPQTIVPTPRPATTSLQPTATLPTSPTATPKPPEGVSPETDPLKVTSVRIADIGPHEFSLRITTNRATRTHISYGTSESLGTDLSDDALSADKVIVFSNLLPGTLYYFRIDVTDQNGAHLTLPELFTVHTASETLPSELDRGTVTVNAQGVSILHGLENTPPEVVLPLDTPIEIIVPFKNTYDGTLTVRIANPQVQGIRIPAAPVFHEFSPLLHSKPQILSGHLLTPSIAGLYNVTLQLRDSGGFLHQEHILSLRMTDRLTVKDTSGRPIESAIISLEYLDTTDRVYKRFPFSSYGLPETPYTLVDGTIPIVLPSQAYRIHISAAGYTPHEELFTFNDRINSAYPQFVLMNAGNTIVSTLRYYESILEDAHYSFRVLLTTTESRRFQQLLFILLLASAALLCLLITLPKKKTHPFLSYSSIMQTIHSTSTGMAHAFFLLLILASIFTVLAHPYGLIDSNQASISTALSTIIIISLLLWGIYIAKKAPIETLRK